MNKRLYNTDQYGIWNYSLLALGGAEYSALKEDGPAHWACWAGGWEEVLLVLHACKLFIQFVLLRGYVTFHCAHPA